MSVGPQNMGLVGSSVTALDMFMFQLSCNWQKSHRFGLCVCVCVSATREEDRKGGVTSHWITSCANSVCCICFSPCVSCCQHFTPIFSFPTFAAHISCVLQGNSQERFLSLKCFFFFLLCYCCCAWNMQFQAQQLQLTSSNHSNLRRQKAVLHVLIRPLCFGFFLPPSLLVCLFVCLFSNCRCVWFSGAC